MLRTLRQDMKAYNLNAITAIFACLTLSVFGLVLSYRISHLLYKVGMPILPEFINRLNRVFFGAEISPQATIGPGLKIYYSVGIVINQGVLAGSNLFLHQGVTLGMRHGQPNPRGKYAPTIEDNVVVYGNSSVLGSVSIGHNAVIGAHSLVIKDVPPNTIVAGSPARVIKQIS